MHCQQSNSPLEDTPPSNPIRDANQPDTERVVAPVKRWMSMAGGLVAAAVLLALVVAVIVMPLAALMALALYAPLWMMLALGERGCA
jgi:hypothetical protein